MKQWMSRAVMGAVLGVCALVAESRAETRNWDQKTLLAQAAIQSASTLGDAYDSTLLAGRGMEKNGSAVHQCTLSFPPSATEGLLVSGIVYADGRIEDAKVLPDTPFARCFLRLFIARKMPPPGQYLLSFAFVVDARTGAPSSGFTLGMDKVFQDKAVDASKPLYHPAPVFPAGAIHDRVTGTPIVAVVVGIGGRPEQVLLDVSSGDDRLDQAAQDAAAQWIFRPNVSKPFKVRIPFTFALTQAES